MVQFGVGFVMGALFGVFIICLVAFHEEDDKHGPR